MRRVALAASVLLAASLLVACSGPAREPIFEQRMHVWDRPLLTTQQQHELVRDGKVIIQLKPGYYVELKNDQSMRPYLNEGGLE